MSVEISGPKGYDYQYLAILYLTLIQIKGTISDFEVFIECEGGEDAVFIFDNGGSSFRVEIQAKDTTSVVSLEKLVQWCCHFEPKSSVSNQLSKLKEKKNDLFLIVTSGRCNDITYAFANKADEKLNTQERSYTAEYLKGIQEQISLYESKASKGIKAERHKFCQTQAKQFEGDSAVFKETLNKVLLNEQLSRDKLISEVDILLNRDFGIPQSTAEPVRNSLLEIIKTEGRDNSKDIYPHLLQKLRTSLGNVPVPSIEYLPRESESQLIDKIDDLNFLYLSGVSFCGKSDTAKNLARHFFLRGFAYRQTQSIEEAKRFLEDIGSEDRICILDDPFGHIVSSDLSVTEWFKIKEIAENLPDHRKLIVTCNSTILDTLVEDQRDWNDLTVKSKIYAISIWQKILGGLKIEYDKDKDELIQGYLMSCVDNEIFQPGQLFFLAKNLESLIDFSKDGIRHFGFFDNQRITSIVKSRGAFGERVFRVLGLLSNHIIPVAVEHVGFVFGEEVQGSIKSKEFSSLFSHNDEEEEDSNYFPVYSKTLISDELQAELDFLEETGLLIRSARSNSYKFPHPAFYEASKSLLTSLPAGKLAQVMSDAERAFAVLEPQNSLQVCEQIKFLVDQYRETGDVVNVLINILKSGFDSIFPSVSDKCLIALIDFLPFLNDKDQVDVNEQIAKQAIFPSSIYWKDDIPFVPSTTSIGGLRGFEEIDLIEDSERRKKIENALINDKSVPIKDAMLYVNAIEKMSKIAPERIPEIALQRLFSYNESFIRETAAYLSLRLYQKPSIENLELAFKDPHPFVVFNAIKGAFRQWYWYSEDIKHKILNLIKTALEDKGVLIRCTRFFVQFGIGYASYSFDWRDHVQKEAVNDMWDLWAELIPDWFEQVPIYIDFHQARFVQGTIEDSKSRIHYSKQLRIADAWQKWLSRKLENHFGNDWLFAVTDYLFDIKTRDFKEKEGLCLALLEQKNEFFSIYNIRHFIHYWEQLSTEVRKALTKKVNQSDIYKAAALTSEDCPTEILNSILKIDTLNDITGLIENEISLELAKQSLHLLYVHPEYRSIYFSAKPLWHDVLEDHLMRDNSPFKKLAMRELFDCHVYDRGPEADRWGDIISKFEVSIKGGDSSLMDFIDLLLIENIVNYNYSNAQPLWEIYLKYCSEERKLKLREKLLECISQIDFNNNLTEINDLFSPSLFVGCKVDVILLLALRVVREEGKPDPPVLSVKEMKKIIKASLGVQGFRLKASYYHLKDWMKENLPQDSKLFIKLEKHWNYIITDKTSCDDNYDLLIHQELVS